MKKEGFSWKEFFRPTKLKIYLALLFLLLCPFVIYMIAYSSFCAGGIYMHEDGLCISSERAIPFMPYWVLLFGFVMFQFIFKINTHLEKAIGPVAIALVINSFFSYLFSCSIVELLKLIKSKKIIVILVTILIVALISLSVYLFYPLLLKFLEPPIPAVAYHGIRTPS